MARPRITEDALRDAVQAYYDNGGNKAEAAAELDLAYSTYCDRLRWAAERLKLQVGKVADGSKDRHTAIRKMPLPSKGKKAAYFLSAVQNNTFLHPGFRNVVALKEWYEQLPEFQTVELLLGTYTYQKARYGEKAVKRGTLKAEDTESGSWYPREAEEYIADDPIELAPGIIWGGNWNILPTTRNPLSGLEALNGRSSNIIPHAKMELASVASMADEATKLNYSTGTVSLKNYIQKKAGILAEEEHNFGFLILEVDDKGSWFVRMLEIGRDDEIMDTGPDGYAGLIVQAGMVEEEHVVDGINWGDVHVAEMLPWVRECCWGENGMLRTLSPRWQFMNDLYSMRSRSHHEIGDFHRTYEKFFAREDSVEEELRQAARFLQEAQNDGTETVIVPSNHDEHLSRWLNEADFRRDPLNAKIFCLLQYQILENIEAGNYAFNPLAWALARFGAPKDVNWLYRDQSFVIADPDGLSGVECGLHGDRGINGARGGTYGFRKLGRKVNKGHDHTAARSGPVMSAGACALRFNYMKGPGSHSVSHILTYKNSARTIITMWKGKWRA